jgi:phasin family protein
MAKDTATNLSEMAERSVEQAAQVAASGMNWMRGLTEENLNRSRVALEGYIETTRVAMDSINRHASELGQRSIATAEETLSNTFDFTDRLMRAKEPKEFAQLQSEFISRQTQCLADQAKEAGEIMMKSAREVANAAVRRTGGTQKGSEAA